MELIIDVMYSKELEANSFIIKEGDIGKYYNITRYLTDTFVYMQMMFLV